MLSAEQQAQVEELLEDARKKLAASETANVYLDLSHGVTREVIVEIAERARAEGWKVRVGAADDNVIITHPR